MSATLAAAGFNRAPLDDDDDDFDPRASGSNVHGYGGVPAVPRRSSSGLAMAASIPSASASGTRMSHVYGETTPFHDDPNFTGDREMGYNPYSDHPYAGGSANAQPPPTAFHMGTFRDRDRRVSAGSMSHAYDGAVTLPQNGGGHQHQQSSSYNTANSHEPLLDGYRGDQRGSTGGGGMPPPYASSLGHRPQHSSTGSSPMDMQPPQSHRVDLPNPTNDARSSVYSTGSAAEPMVMTGVAISTDDHDQPFDDDPFASVYHPPNKTSSNGHGAHDDRLDKRMLDWMGDGGSTRELRDDEDYSRRVLPGPLVVNNPDGSEATVEKGKPKLGVRNRADSVESLS